MIQRGSDITITIFSWRQSSLSKYKIFFYTVPFQEISDYLTKCGHKIDPVILYDTLQYYQIQGTRIIIRPEQYGKHPITDDYVTTMHAQIHVGFEFDRDTYHRVYKSEDVKLYEHLRRRFGKKRSVKK